MRVPLQDGVRETMETQSGYIICTLERLSNRLDIYIREVSTTWSCSPIKAFIVRMTLCEGYQRRIKSQELHLPRVDHIQHI
jgi:hypothetical protein